jgi:hypothetical protein
MSGLLGSDQLTMYKDSYILRGRSFSTGLDNVVEFETVPESEESVREAWQWLSRKTPVPLLS